jgi:hypothetical protein
MRCRQAEKLIFDYIDGAVSESDRLGLERHLGECRTCEATASSLAKSLDLLHRLPKGEPSENFNWKLRLRLAQERNTWRESLGSERLWRGAWRSRFALGAFSAFAVVLAAGFVFLKFSPDAGLVSRGFDLGPEAAPGMGTVAETGRTGALSDRHDPLEVRSFGGFGPRSVSTDAPSGLGLGWVDGGAMLGADSLAFRSIGSRRDYQRIRQLEQQIEILHKELENCNLERRE